MRACVRACMQACGFSRLLFASQFLDDTQRVERNLFKEETGTEHMFKSQFFPNWPFSH